MTRVDPALIDAVIDQAIAEGRLVGAVVLIHQAGNSGYERAAGYLDREAALRMPEDAIFRLTSLSKTITTLAALRLVDQARLRLDDHLSAWIPEFRPLTLEGAEASITIRQLLTHTAGFGYTYLQEPGSPYDQAHVLDGWDPVPPKGVSMAEELSRLNSVPLLFEPGSQWKYSLAIDVLGEVLVRLCGKGLDAIIAEQVTEPLGMRDTGFVLTDADRLVTPYKDGRPAVRMTDPDFVPFMKNGITFSPSRVLRSDSYFSGGGGMLGTATDYMRLLEAIRLGGAGLIPPTMVNAMMTNQIGNLRVDFESTPSWGFGFGGSVLMDPVQARTPQSVGTWKWTGLYGHHWFVDPKQEITAVALTNTSIEGMSGQFVTDLQAAIYGRS